MSKDFNVNLENGIVGAWAYLVEPDTAFNRTVYKANIIFDDEEVKDLYAKFESILEKKKEDEVKKKPRLKNKIQVKNPFEPLIDKEGEEVEGKSFIKIKSKFQPKLFNKKNEQFTPRDVFMGSKVNISLKSNIYYMPSTKSVGVSFLINAIQVIELVEEFDKDFKEKDKKPEVKATTFGFKSVSTDSDVEEVTSNF